MPQSIESLLLDISVVLVTVIVRNDERTQFTVDRIVGWASWTDDPRGVEATCAGVRSGALVGRSAELVMVTG